MTIPCSYILLSSILQDMLGDFVLKGLKGIGGRSGSVGIVLDAVG